MGSYAESLQYLKATLLRTARSTQRTGTRLVAVVPEASPIRHLFDVGAVDSRVPIFESLEEASSALAGP